MEAMPAVSSRSKKYPKSLLLVSLRDPRPIRHPDKCSKLENDATCGLIRAQDIIVTEKDTLDRLQLSIQVLRDYADQLIQIE